MPIFRVKSVKIYTGQKNLHWRRQPRRRQLSGMHLGSFLSELNMFNMFWSNLISNRPHWKSHAHLQCSRLKKDHWARPPFGLARPRIVYRETGFLIRYRLQDTNNMSRRISIWAISIFFSRVCSPTRLGMEWMVFGKTESFSKRWLMPWTTWISQGIASLEISEKTFDYRHFHSVCTI